MCAVGAFSNLSSSKTHPFWRQTRELIENIIDSSTCAFWKTWWHWSPQSSWGLVFCWCFSHRSSKTSIVDSLAASVAKDVCPLVRMLKIQKNNLNLRKGFNLTKSTLWGRNSVYQLTSVSFLPDLRPSWYSGPTNIRDLENGENLGFVNVLRKSKKSGFYMYVSFLFRCDEVNRSGGSCCRKDSFLKQIPRERQRSWECG